MNFRILVWFVLAFAKAYTTQSQVYIDKVNAPKNPLGPYFGLLEAIDVKGPVYSVDFTEFPRDGKPMFTQSTISLEQAIKDKQTYTELKNGLVVNQKLHFNNYVKTYTYNAQNCLVREEYDLWLMVYKYDEKNRLIEETKTDKTKNITDRVTFSYEVENGQLVITSTYYDKDGLRGSAVKDYFKDGLQVLRVSNGKVTLRNNIEFDNRGNWVKKSTNSSYGDYELDRSIVYHDDLDVGIKNKQFSWERLPYTKDATIGFPVLIFPNSKLPEHALQVKKFLAARTLDNSALFFINLGSRYYYGKDAFKDKENIGLKGKAVEIAVGSRVLVETYNNYIKLYDSGKNIKNINHYQLENSYYLTDSLAQNHYVVYNYNSALKKQFHIATKFPAGSMFYTKTAETNSYRFFANGQLLDYSKVGQYKYTQDGTTVVVYNGVPFMILSGNNTNKETGIYLAQPYNGEQLFDNSPTIAASQLASDTKATTSTTFNKNLPIQATKTSDYNFKFYQDGVLIARPDYFVRVIEDKDLLLGYGLEDYLIKDYKTISIGSTVTPIKAAGVNEVIVMYLDGKASYFYNSGMVIKKDDYRIQAVNNQQWLVYFKNINKTIIIDKLKPKTERFVPYFAHSFNNWMCKLPGGGTKFFGYGNLYATNSYQVKIQGANAYIYINNRLSFYFANYTTATVNKPVALISYK
jgi:hypothetical protein